MSTTVSVLQYINALIKRGEASVDELPPICRTCNGWCGSAMTSRAPCPVKQDLGCMIRGLRLKEASG